MEIKKIYMGCTNYNLLLYLVLFSRDMEKTFYIVDKNMDIDLKGFEYIYGEKYIRGKKFKKIKKWLYNQKIKRFFKNNNLNNLDIYGIDHDLYEGYGKRYHNIFLLEDGTSNYMLKERREKRKSFSKVIRQKLLWEFPSFGIHKSVKKIYLTGLGEIPKKIENKVEIFDLKEKWNDLLEIEKNKILEIFKMDRITLKNINDEIEILLTQPLCEDGIISENEKIKLYGEILKKYDKDKILIKPHPREKTDYSKFFPEYKILKSKMPIELFSLLNIKLKRYITIFSTGVLLNNKDIEVDFYGTEIHKKIFEKFGSLEHIYKRNKFL